VSQGSFEFFFFLVKRVPGWGPEQRESEKTVLYPQIIILLISYIIISYIIIELLNYYLTRTIQLKPETELLIPHSFIFV
jgi:hypothetical protein